MSSNNTNLALASLTDYKRYGRQMIINGLGLSAQVKLQNASVLVVGAGGLGCPALQYLCAAGVGRIGIVDHDIVELSNLQRQVLHSEGTIGMPKVDSAAQALKRLNSAIRIDTYNHPLSPSNAESLLSQYDITIDCTDNAPARYLLSDTSVRIGRPLVSGAAQRLDGQLCTYNLPFKSDSDSGVEREDRGPCYRCLFPKPPAPEMAGSCEETGILGAVTGVIGSLQALEAIKIIAGLHDGKPTLLIYSALATPPFRSIKLRTRRNTCPACGDDGARLGSISELDYVAFCGGPRPDWVSRGLVVDESQRRITAIELRRRLDDTSTHNLRIVDVRTPVEFNICHLPHSENIPLSEIVASPTSHIAPSSSSSSKNFGSGTDDSTILQLEQNALCVVVVVVCRLGNDSQIAADALRSLSLNSSSSSTEVEVVDLVGGLRSWATDVDRGFPVY